MAALLAGQTLTAKELAGIMLLDPPEAADHLSHLMKTHGKALKMKPAQCLGCGFVFTKSRKPSPPGRCPQCRGHRIEGPWFSLEHPNGQHT